MTDDDRRCESCGKRRELYVVTFPRQEAAPFHVCEHCAREAEEHGGTVQR